jgi:hypothetical protein
MRKQGFSVPDNFFSAVAACARARSTDREHTGRVTTDGTAICDFKGRFPCAKGGGCTSLIAFRHPVSGYVHEEHLVDQTVPSAVAAFVLFRDLMRVKFRVTINYMVFDRDASFNRNFRAQLYKLDVDSNMSGANDHWELGAIETYWDTWTSMVAAFTMHAGLDATYWRFAFGMANLGYISPIEYLTNEVPDLSHLRAPFSPSYVAQEKKKGALTCRSLEGIFVDYPEDAREGVWVHYMPSTKSTQVSRHAVFNEWAHFKGSVFDELRSTRRVELADSVAALESATATPASKSAPPPIVAGAIAADHYFVCNAAQVDKATAYIRDRCIRFHGLRVRDALKGQYILAFADCAKKWKSWEAVEKQAPNLAALLTFTVEEYNAVWHTGFKPLVTLRLISLNWRQLTENDLVDVLVRRDTMANSKEKQDSLTVNTCDNGAPKLASRSNDAPNTGGFRSVDVFLSVFNNIERMIQMCRGEQFGKQLMAPIRRDIEAMMVHTKKATYPLQQLWLKLQREVMSSYVAYVRHSPPDPRRPRI